MNNKPLSLRHVLDKLEALYGPPAPPKITVPLEMILWENVAYLTDDTRREVAFRMLRERVGFEPHQILEAPVRTLTEIGRYGILPELTVNKLRHVAQMAAAPGGDPGAAARLPLKKARQALAKFPGIGEIGAERILLYSRSHAVPALEANGMRVLLRLGFGKEKKDIAATYRSVQEAMDAGENYDFLIRAHLLLRRHGEVLCLRNEPLCGQCPLAQRCFYVRAVTEKKKAAATTARKATRAA